MTRSRRSPHRGRQREPSLAPISEQNVTTTPVSAALHGIEDDGGGVRSNDTPQSVGSNNSGTEQQQPDGTPILVSTEHGTGASWELTWPIWHMLPHAERKAIATEHGYRSIGEFEEYVTLRRAVGDSSSSAVGGVGSDDGTGMGVPYSNDILYEMENDPNNYGRGTIASRGNPSVDDGGKPSVGAEEDGGSESSDTEEEEEKNEKQPSTGKIKTTTSPDADATESDSEEELTHDELIRRGGPFLLLPDEMLHRLFSYLPLDAYGVIALVSPHWHAFTRTEAVYKMLCVRCYLKQSKRKALHVSRFGGSYRRMLEERPRVRTGGGLYVLKYSSVKKIQRDMWTEIPVGAILETVYYRYLYFQENGTVLYALTTSPPHEMIARFHKMKITNEPDRSGVWGRYEVQKHDVSVWASQPWHDVRMELKILPKGSVEGARGKFCALSFERHMSSASGDFDEYYSHDLVEYKVPEEPFRFLRDWRL